MPKTRILHLYQDFFPKRGGIEDHMLTLAQQPSIHYEHQVLAAADGPVTRREIVAGVPVVRAATLAHYYTPFCPTMLYWIRQMRPDLLHVHHPCPMAFVASVGRRAGVPMVVGYHNDIVKPRSLFTVYAPLQKAVLRRAKAILVGTQSYLEASPFLAAVRERCHVVPYGIDLAGLQLTPAIRQQRDTIRQRHPGPLVLFMGRLCYYKGLHVAIQAMQAVNATLLLVGTGPLRSQVVEQIQAYGIPYAYRFPHRVAVQPMDRRAPTTTLLEYPISTTRLFNLNFPFSGGFYARLLPYAFLQKLIRTTNAAGQPVIFYLHPWELDPEHPRLVDRVAPLYRFTHYYNLASMTAKLQRLLAEFRFVPLAELAEPVMTFTEADLTMQKTGGKERVSYARTTR